MFFLSPTYDKKEDVILTMTDNPLSFDSILNQVTSTLKVVEIRLYNTFHQVGIDNDQFWIEAPIYATISDALFLKNVIQPFQFLAI